MHFHILDFSGHLVGVSEDTCFCEVQLNYNAEVHFVAALFYKTWCVMNVKVYHVFTVYWASFKLSLFLFQFVVLPWLCDFCNTRIHYIGYYWLSPQKLNNEQCAWYFKFHVLLSFYDLLPCYVIIIIIIIGSTAPGGPWPRQANVTSDSILRICPPISKTQFPCIFLYPVNLSWFWSAMSSLTSRVYPQYPFR
jgi:hypothetical protein